MKNIFIFLIITAFSFSVMGNAVAISGTGTSNTTVKRVVKKPILKKIVKKEVRKASSGSTQVTYALNKPFVLGDIEYTILSIHSFDKIGHYFDVKTPYNGKFLIVEFTYKNLSKDDDKTVESFYIHNGEDIYSEDSIAKVYSEEQMNWNQGISDNFIGYIPPGMKKRVYVGFDVPDKAISQGSIYLSYEPPILNSKTQRVTIPLSSLK